MAFRTTSVLRTFALRKWAYNKAGFCQYGLYRDDVIYEGDEDVIEALRRLPQSVKDERNFRSLRAIQLSLVKKVLPKNEWIKFEEDRPYLEPIIQQVKKERLEREKWDENH